MKIVLADANDALLSLRVLFKIANIIITQNATDHHDEDAFHVRDISVAHRIQHVADCVLLSASTLHVEDLIVAAWSLSTIKLENEDYIRSIMEEYRKRLDRHRVFKMDVNSTLEIPATGILQIEDIAGMMWTVGGVKDQYGWGNSTLLNDLAVALQTSSTDGKSPFAILNPRLTVRVLWSLAVFDVIHLYPTIFHDGILSILGQGFDSLSVTNKISLLWCVALSQQANATLAVPVINAVNDVAHRYNFLAPHETDYLLQSAKTLNDQMRARLVQKKSLAIDDISDEMQILRANGRMLSTVMTSAVQSPFATLSSFSSLLHIVRALSKVEFIEEADQRCACEFFNNFRRLLDQALGSPGNISNNTDSSRLAFTPTDAAEVLELMATTVDYPHLLIGDEKRQQSVLQKSTQSEESGRLLPVEEKTNLPKAISSSIARSNVIQWSNSSLLSWYLLAGRLAVVVSCNQHLISDRTTSVHAAWSLARLGQHFRPLTKLARRFAETERIADLPITLLSRLVVVLAAEQASSINNPLTVKTPVSFEVLARVSTTVLQRVSELQSSVSELVQTLFSVAYLGKLPSYIKMTTSEVLNRANTTKDAIQTTALNSSASSMAKELHLNPVNLAFLSTPEVIGLYWASRQLHTMNNVQVFDSETRLHLVKDVQRRLPVHILPGGRNVSSGRNGDGSKVMNVKDSFLLVKSLTHSATLKESSLEPLRDQACTILMQHCAQYFQPTSGSSSPSYDYDHSMSGDDAHELQTQIDGSLEANQEAEEVATEVSASAFHPVKPYGGDESLSIPQQTHLTVLIDALQAFVELRWFKEDMVATVEAALQKLSAIMTACDEGNDAALALNQETLQIMHFQYGVLSQLLDTYCQISQVGSSAASVAGLSYGGNVGNVERRPLLKHFPRLHGLLSRFFCHRP